jgi:hypothetical protein
VLGEIQCCSHSQASDRSQVYSTSAQSQFLPSPRLHFLSCFDSCPLQVSRGQVLEFSRDCVLACDRQFHPVPICAPSSVAWLLCSVRSLRSCVAQPVTSSVHTTSQSLAAAYSFFFTQVVFSHRCSLRSCLPAAAWISVCLTYRTGSHFPPPKSLFRHGGCELVSSAEPTRTVTHTRRCCFKLLALNTPSRFYWILRRLWYLFW